MMHISRIFFSEVAFFLTLDTFMIGSKNNPSSDQIKQVNVDERFSIGGLFAFGQDEG